LDIFTVSWVNNEFLGQPTKEKSLQRLNSAHTIIEDKTTPVEIEKLGAAKQYPLSKQFLNFEYLL